MEIASDATPRFTPRAHLNSQETVLFDTRPHFLAVVSLWPVIWFVIGSVIVPAFADGVAQGLGARGQFWYMFIPWVLLVLLPLVTRVLAWRHEFYCLTDQRIMHGHGFISRALDARQLTRIGGVLDVSTYRITGVTFSQRFWGRVFGYGNLNFQTNHGSIFWHGIKDPLNVRRLIEEKIAAFQDVGANKATYNEAVIRRVAEIQTEASFGLIEPRRQAAIPGQVAIPGMEGMTALPPAASGVRYCPNCGGQQPAEAAFCQRCGHRLG